MEVGICRLYMRQVCKGYVNVMKATVGVDLRLTYRRHPAIVSRTSISRYAHGNEGRSYIARRPARALDGSTSLADRLQGAPMRRL